MPIPNPGAQGINTVEKAGNMSEKNLFKASHIVRDALSGHPRKIRGEFELPTSDTLEKSIVTFLVANSADLGLALQTKDLKKTQDVTTPTGRVARFIKTRDGIPIIGTEIHVVLDRTSKIKQIDVEHITAENVLQPSGRKKILTDDAVVKKVRSSLGVHTLRQKVNPPRKVYLPTPEGLQLAYEVIILTREPLHDWYITANAYTGEILTQQDRIWKANGQGKVFDPNPVVTASNNTLRDPTAAATCGFTASPQATVDNEQVTRTLTGLTLSAGKYKLEGPYVKLRDFGPPNTTPPEETNANAFTYASNNGGFEAVMIYYHIDTLQRYIQNTLGITNANNRQIEADAHDNDGGGGGFYSPGDLGVHFGDSGPCQPDRAEDADCICHEYNHATMDNVVPGYGPMQYVTGVGWMGVPNPTTNRRESRAIGEGFSDALPCIYFAPDHPFQREVFEDWAFVPAGLRRVDETKHYPNVTPNDWMDDEHADGEIWSAALWNIYRTIGGDSANTATQRAARDELLKTMISSYFVLTTNPNMMDAAEAILDTNTDLPEFRLIHGVEMLDSFHDRAILRCHADSNLKITEVWSQQNETPEVGYQQVEAGQDNWFYAKVRNDGTANARVFVVEFSFKSPFSTPVYPSDFRDHIISGAVGYDLAPGSTATVRGQWPKELIPPIPTGTTSRHGCIFAEVYNPADHVPAGVTTLGGSNGKLRQMNTTIVDQIPDANADFLFTVSNYYIAKPQWIRLELIRPAPWENLEVTLSHHDPTQIQKLWNNIEKIQKLPVKTEVPAVSPPEVKIIESTKIAVSVSPEKPWLLIDLARGSTLRTSDQPAYVEETRDDFVHPDVDLVNMKGQMLMKFRPGLKAGLPFEMIPRERVTLKVTIKVPSNAKPGDKIKAEMTQNDAAGNLVGGFNVLINVVAKK